MSKDPVLDRTKTSATGWYSHWKKILWRNAPDTPEQYLNFQLEMKLYHFEKNLEDVQRYHRLEAERKRKENAFKFNPLQG